jgi:hypothetical protein
MAPIIRTIFTTEGLPPPVKYTAAKNLSASRWFEIELNQNGRHNPEVRKNLVWEIAKILRGPSRPPAENEFWPSGGACPDRAKFFVTPPVRAG